MDRYRNELIVNEEQLFNMSSIEKLQLIDDYNQLFHHELSRIPYTELVVSEKGDAVSIAEAYYRREGYEVYRSRINNGYRSITVELHGDEYKSILSEQDERLIKLLKGLMSQKEFKELAAMVQKINRTPDLLLIRNNKISFIEVKDNHDTVKSSTVEFYLKYGDKWPLSILRVIRKTLL